MSDSLSESDPDRRDLLALQTAIDQSIVRRASELTMAEKLRMGADLYDDGIRWLRQILKAEDPTLTDKQVDQELDRRRAIVRQIEDAGRFRPYVEDDAN